MVCCDTCGYWVHQQCDRDLTGEEYYAFTSGSKKRYFCPPCRDKVRMLSQQRLPTVVGFGIVSAMPLVWLVLFVLVRDVWCIFFILRRGQNDFFYNIRSDSTNEHADDST